MNKLAIDDIPPPEINLPILPNRPGSIQNTFWKKIYKLCFWHRFTCKGCCMR